MRTARYFIACLALTVVATTNVSRAAIITQAETVNDMLTAEANAVEQFDTSLGRLESLDVDSMAENRDAAAVAQGEEETPVTEQPNIDFAAAFLQNDDELSLALEQNEDEEDVVFSFSAGEDSYAGQDGRVENVRDMEVDRIVGYAYHADYIGDETFVLNADYYAYINQLVLTDLQRALPVVTAELQAVYGYAPVPEPASMALLGVGAAALLARHRRRGRKR